MSEKLLSFDPFSFIFNEEQQLSGASVKTLPTFPKRMEQEKEVTLLKTGTEEKRGDDHVPEDNLFRESNFKCKVQY